MRHTYYYLQNAISSEDCDKIVENHKDNTRNARIVNSDQGKEIQDNVRRSKIQWVTDPALRDYVIQLSHKMNRSAFGFDLWQNDYFDIQFTEYNSNDKGHYNWHIDSHDGEDAIYEQRKLSIVIQLTDPSEYTGGEFQMMNSSKEYSLTEAKGKGTILAFPSYVIHRVTPVTSGIRHSLVTWLTGPAFK